MRGWAPSANVTGAKLESVLLEYILDKYSGDSLHKIGVLWTRRVYIASNIITAISSQVTSRIFLPISILQCPECAPTREKSLGPSMGLGLNLGDVSVGPNPHPDPPLPRPVPQNVDPSMGRSLPCLNSRKILSL